MCVCVCDREYKRAIERETEREREREKEKERERNIALGMPKCLASWPGCSSQPAGNRQQSRHMELCIRELAATAAEKEKDNNKLQQAAQQLEFDTQQIAQKGERNYIIEDAKLLKPNKCLKIAQIYVPIKICVRE